jgi:hypothetical protein
MTMSQILSDSDDQPLVHQFIRRFGYRPTPDELSRYEHARASLAVQIPARVRRRVARIITRM